MHISRAIWSVVIGLGTAAAALAQPASWTLTNPAGDFRDEVVRLPVELKAPLEPGQLVVREDGREVPCQLEMDNGQPRLWVAVTVAKGQSRRYEVARGSAKPATPKVSVKREGDVYVLDNGVVAVRVPAAASGGAMPGPIAGLRAGAGPWIGASAWTTSLKLRKFTSTLAADGTVFGKVVLRYEFEPTPALAAPMAEVSVSLAPNHAAAVVRERHWMNEGDAWEFQLSQGWSPNAGAMRRWFSGPFQGDEKLQATTLKPGQTRMGDVLVKLQPRWTQGYDEGWFFAATDGTSMAGAIPAWPSQWFWPHLNLIDVRLRDAGDYAGLRCPTWRGERAWLLLAGPAALIDQAEPIVRGIAMQNLDKLVNQYISAWPGMTKGAFWSEFPYTNNVNPTGIRRQMGKRAVADAAAGKTGDLTTLFQAQVQLDPDFYGSYYNHWSPINPNFFTDFVRVPIAQTVMLRQHPRFKELAKLAEAKLREDIDFSVTLPGGAGQECPGYQSHAAMVWAELAPLCKQHLGFDPTTWPRFKAVGSFVMHLSQPLGGGKRGFHPGGDTHPGRPDPAEYAAKFGYTADPRSFVTEELPGFGVVFRNRPGTERETYLAFKAGPNRGHYHGDQLSFHYCDNATPLAVDHHCSYKPRAGQEHMHNRLSFSTKELPYANMDGYERVIALAAHRDVDIAIGQVESPRLRITTPLPPEEWNVDQPQVRLDKPLVYRRTIVMLKNGPRDYFVLRDQYWGPAVNAHWNLHVLGNACQRAGQTIACDNLNVFVAAPAEFAFEKFEWQHENGGLEKTAGPRLTISGNRGEFITVLYPGPAKQMPPMAAIPGGVRVGDDEITFAGAEPEVAVDVACVTVKRGGKPLATLTGKQIDLNRFQGDIGLFVPNVGYPFGPIPDWLIRQRAPRSIP